MKQATEKPASTMQHLVGELSKDISAVDAAPKKRTDDTLLKDAGFKNAAEALAKLKEVSHDKEQLEALIKQFLELPDSVVYMRLIDGNSLLGSTKVATVYRKMRNAVRPDKSLLG